MQIDLLLNIISLYCIEKLLIHASVCCFCFTQLLPKPFQRAIEQRDGGFLLSHLSPESVWSTAAKYCSSVHSSSLGSHPKESTCQSPDVVGCPRKKKRKKTTTKKSSRTRARLSFPFHPMYYLNHFQDKMLAHHDGLHCVP